MISPLVGGPTPIPGSTVKSLYSGNIVEFLWTLKKEGLKETTIIQNYSKVLKHLSKNCKLENTDSVLSYLATKEVSEGRKELMVDVYARYCGWRNIPFSKPRYRRQDRLPCVPLEIDIEALISALPRKLSQRGYYCLDTRLNQRKNMSKVQNRKRLKPSNYAIIRNRRAFHKFYLRKTMIFNY